jgi:nucleoside-diphosphate-sugar epimerase
LYRFLAIAVLLDVKTYLKSDHFNGGGSNIEHLKSDTRFHCTIDSVLNERVTAKLIQSADVVFHLAAAVGVRRMIESPVKTIENNVRGTEIVLELADDWKKKYY